MEKLEYQEKDGKVFCPLANKWLVAKPEEKVRQKYICILVNDYGYSLDQMAQEQKVNNSQRGQGKARADIVIWKSKKDKDDRKAAFIVVECKAENVKIRVEDYYQGFNYAAWAHADFFVTTNEKETKFFNVDPAFLPQKLEEVIAIPTAEDVDNAQKIEQIKNQTKTFTREEFTKTLQACHNIIRNNDKLSPEAAFDEISKLLFMKIRYERQQRGTKVFTKAEYLSQADNYEKNLRPGLKAKGIDQPYMQNLFDTTKIEFKGDHLFEDNDEIKIRENSFVQILEKLENYNLSDTQDDVKGIAFEQFLGTTFRGELGQFFTPRTIVDFMTEILDPQEGEIICDPTCGSGGFLIKAFEYVREKIEADVRAQKEKLRASLEGDGFNSKPENEQIEISDRIDKMQTALNTELDTSIEGSRMYQLSRNCIYGTDANPRMARTSKMNMIMHGDGHGGVHHHDGLLNVNGIFEERFDVILTNPPFGQNVDRNQLISVADRFTDEEMKQKYKAKYGKYLPLKCATTNKEPDKWLLRNGDFLITRTNGSKDLVGKAAVFHGKDVYTYASYLIRYRFDISIVLPEYVNILFMTQLVREQIAVMRRQGGGQYNLNSDEIGAIRIPVPSIPEQQAIVAAYDSAKDGANIYYDKGQTLKEKAAADFEKCIFA